MHIIEIPGRGSWLLSIFRGIAGARARDLNSHSIYLQSIWRFLWREKMKEKKADVLKIHLSHLRPFSARESRVGKLAVVRSYVRRRRVIRSRDV